MKLMQIYESLLSEGLSPILYHKTHINALYKILKDDQFKLSTSIGTSSDHKAAKGGKFYYLSTARSMTSGYFWTGDWTIFLTLDGRKLGQNYKGTSIDYWGYSANPKDYTDTQQFSQAQQSKELEDRVLSDEPLIPNAMKYIMSISIMIPSKRENKISYMDQHFMRQKGKSEEEIQAAMGDYIVDEMEPDRVSMLRKILIMAKKNSIPVFLYLKKEDAVTGNTKRAIDISDLDLSARVKKDSPYYSDSHRRGYYNKALVLAYYAKSYENDIVPNRGLYDFIRGLVYDNYRSDDIMRSLNNDIHNAKSDNNRWNNQIVKLMRKHKFQNVKQLVDYVREKWKGKIR